ncbi:MAG TPA: HNH endonuclease, partial [Arthrobacter sp.]|nr:HNH endonuclease [Arthrobacter sp.]
MDGKRESDGLSAAAVSGMDGGTVTDEARALVTVRPVSDGARLIAEIRDLEDRKSALAARQARLSVAFDLLQRRE